MQFEFELNGDKFVIFPSVGFFSTYIRRNGNIELYIEEIENNKIIFPPDPLEERKLKIEFARIEQYRIILKRYNKLINLL